MNVDRSAAQQLTPIIQALATSRRTATAAFHTPGHNRGQTIPAAMATLVGVLPYQIDLPDLPGLSLFEADGAIAKSQGLAAELFGAEQTWFLVNGSTVGIIAAILSTCGAGEKIILPRNVHQSVISGLVLSGACPVFVQPESDPSWDLAYCLTPTSVAQALRLHPDARAVLMVSPTYHGVCGNVRAVATLTHQHNIPLIVDEAHGAHLAFHSELPLSALASGADLVVQSTHKLLAALTQSAMLHRQGSRVNSDRVTQMLQILQSSSPSNLLLASLDAARHLMATQGEALMDRTLQLSHRARTALRQAGFQLLDPPARPTEGFTDLDLTRLVVNVSAFGLDGFTADTLLTQSGVIAELPTLRQLAFIISLGNTSAEIERLISELVALTLTQHRPCTLPQPASIFNALPIQVPSLTPREALYAPHIQLGLEQAVGYISAETLCPYPPGIPLLLPGEVITAEAIARLQEIKAHGGLVSGASDPDLAQLLVVKPTEFTS